MEPRESASGYKPPWAEQVETQPSPHDLHALITPPERLNVTLKVTFRSLVDRGSLIGYFPYPGHRTYLKSLLDSLRKASVPEKNRSR